MTSLISLDAELPTEETIPTIDFGLLVNGTPEQRSAMVRLLATACEDWGFFMVLIMMCIICLAWPMLHVSSCLFLFNKLVNHGIPERLRDEMLEAFKALFDLTDDEKGSYNGAHVLDPIRIGSGFNSITDTGECQCVRHYAKIMVHPEFHSVPKPLNFRNISKEYSDCTRVIGLELLKAIWEGLGIKESRDMEALNLSLCTQHLAGNLYPQYLNPGIAFGLVPHSDLGFLTLVYQNGVDGLEIMHKDRWIYVKPVPNSIMVNVGDHMEIVSNGKYKSVLHRAMLNREMARMSIVIVIGPSLDAIVEPIADLVNDDSPAVFRGMMYRDYMEHQQSNILVEKRALNLSERTVVRMRLENDEAEHCSHDAELPNEETIPTIDFGLLVNGTPDQRSAMVRLLATACEDWGFFMLVNHGIKDRLRDEMLEAFKAFFDLTDDEKGSYIRAHVLDPIRTGSGFNSKTDTGKCSRHYVKIFVHPEFHSVSKPHNFRNISKEYSESTRAIGLELLKAIWEGLGIEESQVAKAVKLGSCFQILVGNLYPPYPEPDSELGFAPHSDHGFLTLLYQNGVNGLQIMHKERWIYVKPVPNSIMVNTGDHLEIVSNGKYKSVLHRAVLNSEMARMSIVTVIGPSLDAIVEPIADLVNADSPAVFRGLTYRDYLEHQQSNSLVEKGALNLVTL
ncbi:putative 2-oxoglutarate/Fe(II)-dependent dioxygenase [Carex littledalei]|uniref:Putative 2-oxoglutarate/Fe(II)-dependent dioxygenase n=1 Tax=Carex littledalei TaxID=544730 RepID=A0A833RU30_9POAL|nr:putative 2-oxoglutarate/Fe(II)-dependent dioxygenase [Carex littledalei]